MEKDSGVRLTQLKVDGGMTANALLMQIQADILNVPVIRPVVTETTVLGAAYAAGLAVGFWTDKDELCRYWHVDRVWNAETTESRRAAGYAKWKKAVDRTLNWVD
jgi:glycerol kinase